MSTKCTISHDDEYHLYQECFENDNVHLRLDDIGEMEMSHHTDGSFTGTVSIPVKTWRKIVEGWLKSQWAKDPSRDNKNPFDDYDEDALVRWMEEREEDLE